MGSTFEGACAWITGGGSGLGRGMALELCSRGAKVAVSGRRADRLDEVVAQIEAAGGEALAVPCDCTEEAQIADAVARVVDTWGKLDVAIANAGFAVGGPVERLSADDWRRQLDVNVVGAALTARHAIPALRATRGRLALVGSVSALAYAPGNSAYQASKAAVLALGRTLSMELAPDGISCTTLQPGFVRSEIAQVDNQGRWDPERADRRPARLMWETEPAARKMIDAIARRKVEYTFTGHGRLAAFVGRHMPWVLQIAGGRMARQKSPS